MTGRKANLLSLFKEMRWLSRKASAWQITAQIRSKSFSQSIGRWELEETVSHFLGRDVGHFTEGHCDQIPQASLNTDETHS